MRAPRWARRLSSTRSSSSRSSTADAVRVLAQPLPDRRQPAAIRLGRVPLRRQVDGPDSGVGVDQRARHPPRGCELADVAAKELPYERRAALHRLAHRLGACVRVSVQVAADPRAEAKRGAGQPLAPGREKGGRGVPQAVLEKPEHLPDLVDDAGPLRPDLVRLPEDGDLLRQRVLSDGALGTGEPGVVELLEELRDPAVLLEDRARQRLGRMGGQHELDRDPARRRLDLVAGHAVVLERSEGLVEGLAQHPALPLDLSTPPDSVVLLGDVGQVEVDGERPQHDRLGLDAEQRDRLGEGPRRACVAAATEPGEQADPLLQAVHVLAFLLAEDAPEDLAEQADVGAERSVRRRVGRAAHRPTLPGRSVVTRRRRTASRPGRAPSRPRRRDRAAARR